MFRVVKPIHQTWHVTALLFGVIMGLGVSPLVKGEVFTGAAWLVVAVICMMACLWKRWAGLIVIAFVSGMLGGILRGVNDRSSMTVYEPLYKKIVTVQGVVLEDIETSSKSGTIIRLGEVRFRGDKMPGKLWVTTREHIDVRRGDTVTVKGKLMPGFASFVGSMQRSDVVEVIKTSVRDPALGVRDWFSEQVRKGIHEPAASLGLGFVTGQRRELPADVYESLKMAGLTHIIVASGYNLTILVRLVKRRFEKHSRYLTIYASLMMIAGFIAVSGASPSMVRAGLVSMLVLLAWYVGRRYHPVTLLALTGAATGLYNPSYVWGDMGWQLSFAAFGGVMILAPLLQVYFFGERKPGILRQVIGETVSATIVTTPLILYAFGVTSGVALLANVLIVPFIPLAMLLVLLAGIAGMLGGVVSAVIGMPARVLLDAMIAIARWCADLPWASVKLSIPWWTALMMYGGIVVLCVYLRYVTKYHLWRSSIID